jgi:hypothetical protein
MTPLGDVFASRKVFDSTALCVKALAEEPWNAAIDSQESKIREVFSFQHVMIRK